MRRVILLLLGCWAVATIVVSIGCRHRTMKEWTPPDTTTIPRTAAGDLIRYGRELIVHTATYLGPAGSVASISNGMNCQNCHLDAGTKLMGNNYAASAANFPRYRARSGTIESLRKKVNDCLIRSLNGVPLDSNSREMSAIIAYMQWLGKDVPKGGKPVGSGLQELPYMSRAADTAKGRLVFQRQCVQCHGSDGGGLHDASGVNYLYPPLWGIRSYNNGAGIFRLSKFAAYVKANMPFNNAHLTDEEAWDVAAFVNSQTRPEKVFPEDWPDIKEKPVDIATGPFPDTFSIAQHKYGPFGPIVKSRKTK